MGWIPYLLERIDDVWETHRGWSHSHEYTKEKPSAMYHDHVYSTFFKDPVGIRAARPDRRGQRDFRERLPPPGRHLALHP